MPRLTQAQSYSFLIFLWLGYTFFSFCGWWFFAKMRYFKCYNVSALEIRVFPSHQGSLLLFVVGCCCLFLTFLHFFCIKSVFSVGYDHQRLYSISLVVSKCFERYLFKLLEQRKRKGKILFYVLMIGSVLGPPSMLIQAIYNSALAFTSNFLKASRSARDEGLWLSQVISGHMNSFAHVHALLNCQVYVIACQGDLSQPPC